MVVSTCCRATNGEAEVHRCLSLTCPALTGFAYEHLQDLVLVGISDAKAPQGANILA